MHTLSCFGLTSTAVLSRLLVRVSTASCIIVAGCFAGTFLCCVYLGISGTSFIRCGWMRPCEGAEHLCVMHLASVACAAVHPGDLTALLGSNWGAKTGLGKVCAADYGTTLQSPDSCTCLVSLCLGMVGLSTLLVCVCIHMSTSLLDSCSRHPGGWV